MSRPVSPPDLPDAWQLEDEPLPPLGFVAAAASLMALCGLVYLIASPLILIRKLAR